MHVSKKLFDLMLILVSVTIFMAGCGYKSIKHGTEISEDQIKKIVIGQTTKNDILIEFGDPSKIMNDDKVYFYSWTRGSKGHVLGLGSGDAYTYSLVVIFNDNGVVEKHKITRGTTKAATGIGD